MVWSWFEAICYQTWRFVCHHDSGVSGSSVRSTGEKRSALIVSLSCIIWSLQCLGFVYTIWWNTGLLSVTEKISSSLKMFLDSILTAMCGLGGGRQINRDLGTDKYAHHRWMTEDEKTKWGVKELQHPTHLNMKLIQNERVFHQDSFFIMVWYLKIIHERKVTFKNSWVTTTLGEHRGKYLLAFTTWNHLTRHFQDVLKTVLKWESKKCDGLKIRAQWLDSLDTFRQTQEKCFNTGTNLHFWKHSWAERLL